MEVDVMGKTIGVGLSRRGGESGDMRGGDRRGESVLRLVCAANGT